MPSSVAARGDHGDPDHCVILPRTARTADLPLVQDPSSVASLAHFLHCFVCAMSRGALHGAPSPLTLFKRSTRTTPITPRGRERAPRMRMPWPDLRRAYQQPGPHVIWFRAQYQRRTSPCLLAARLRVERQSNEIRFYESGGRPKPPRPRHPTRDTNSAPEVRPRRAQIPWRILRGGSRRTRRAARSGRSADASGKDAGTGPG